jgi:hypothetical protein
MLTGPRPIFAEAAKNTVNNENHRTWYSSMYLMSQIPKSYVISNIPYPFHSYTAAVQNKDSPLQLNNTKNGEYNTN